MNETTEDAVDNNVEKLFIYIFLDEEGEDAEINILKKC